MRNLLALVFLSTFISFKAFAIPKFSIEKINGFEVHFVDIGRGDRFGIAAYEPLGTLHESGRLLGRAHLLEHLLHTGSLRHPGYHTYRDRLKAANVISNASTSYNRTFYFAGVTESETESVIDIFSSMFGGLEWNPETFEKEKGVVIEEIAHQSMKKEAWAAFHMPMTRLVHPEHPWAHPPLGTLESLKGLTMGDVKDLYYQNYVPGHLKFAVVGNFSSPERLAKVKGWLGQYLQPARMDQDPHKYQSKAPLLASQPVPSLFSSVTLPDESNRRIYIHSNSVKSGMVSMEAHYEAKDFDTDKLDPFVWYLNMNAPGGLLHRLRTDKGWITSGGYSSQVFANRIRLIFSYVLTDEGLNHIDDIEAEAFKAVRAAQVYGPDAPTLELIKKAIKMAFEQSTRSVESTLQLLPDLLAPSKTPERQILEIDQLRPEDVQESARLFRPDLALYAVMGPAKSGMTHDPDYDRAYRIEDNQVARARYMEIFAKEPEEKYRPQVKAVPLTELPEKTLSKEFAQIRDVSKIDERITLDSRMDLPNNAIEIKFNFQPNSGQHQIALSLVGMAFVERYSGELGGLRYQYQMSSGFSVGTEAFGVSVSGENGYSVPTVEWFLNHLSEFMPTEDELRRAKRRFAEGSAQAYAGNFTAKDALSEIKQRIDHLQLAELATRDMALSLDESEIMALWREALVRSSKHIVMVGPFDRSDIERVKNAAYGFSPFEPSAEFLNKRHERMKFPDEKRRDVIPFPEAKGATAYGLARAYRGPMQTEVHDSIAMSVINDVLSRKVSQYNRSERSLGYVHSTTSALLGGKHQFFIFFGQAEGAENALETISGWEYVMAQLESGAITDEDLEKGIQSVKSSLLQQRMDARELLSRYSYGQSHRDSALSFEDMIEALNKMTAAEIRNVAHKYILSKDLPYHEVVMGDCEAFLGLAESKL